MGMSRGPASKSTHQPNIGDDSFEELDAALGLSLHPACKSAAASHWQVNKDLKDDKSLEEGIKRANNSSDANNSDINKMADKDTNNDDTNITSPGEGPPNKRARQESPLQPLPNPGNDDQAITGLSTVALPQDGQATVVAVPVNATTAEGDAPEAESSEQLAKAVGEVAEAMLAMANQGIYTKDEAAKPNSRKRNSPCFFTQQEDLLLAQLVERRGPRAWSKIALSFPFKNGKQCRARWYTHLDPAVRKLPFSLEEDGLLLSKHAELGNCWSTIAKGISGRTELSVRNRWNAHLRARVESSGMSEAAYAQRLLAAVEFGAGVAQVPAPAEEGAETDKQRSRVGCAQYSCVGFKSQDLGISFEPSNYKFVQDRLARVVMIKGEEAMKGKVKVGMVVVTVNDQWCPSLSFQETYNLIQNTKERPINILFGDESLIPEDKVLPFAVAVAVAVGVEIAD